MDKVVKTVAIIGAGNGGLAAAADLSDRGFHVNIYQSTACDEHLGSICKSGGLTLKEPGKLDQFCPINMVTANISEAIEDAEIIMITVPGFAVESIAAMLAPVVREDQLILFNAAAAMNCVRFTNQAKQMGIERNFLIAETNSLSYGTRAFAESACVELLLRVKKLFLAAYPKERTQEALKLARQIYDCFVPAYHILHTTLENGNPEVHPGPCLLNAGRIEYSKGEFWFYKEGITEHTLNVLLAISRERMEIGRKFGLALEDAKTSRSNRGYFDATTGLNLQELFNTSQVYGEIKGPLSVTSRYFIEDIQDGLVLWSDLGKLVGVSTPVIDSVITLGSAMLNMDFFAKGLTLERIGLPTSSVGDLLASI